MRLMLSQAKSAYSEVCAAIADGQKGGFSEATMQSLEDARHRMQVEIRAEVDRREAERAARDLTT